MGHDKLENSGVLKMRSSCSKMLLGTLIIYLSMLNLDNIVDSASTRAKEEDSSGRASTVVVLKGGAADRGDQSP